MAGLTADDWAEYLTLAPDEDISRPLWWYPPNAAKAVEHERARRGILRIDLEPVGDPEYS